MRDRLERVELPGEEVAQERAWALVRQAHAEREPVLQPPRRLRPALVLAVVLALVAAALSPPGRAVVDEIRGAVGVERAQPALFALPSPGRLLVASDAGLWIVHQDGSKRLLGDYREASWSPFGRFVVASRANELAALEPDGDVRWTLARAGVRSPRWAGSETDTRIAYADRTGIRVVGGDGTGDRLIVPGVPGPLAWRPGDGFVLAYATPGRVTVVDIATGRVLWQRRRPSGGPLSLEWLARGRLVLATRRAITVYGEDGAVVDGFGLRARVTAAAPAPGRRQLVIAQMLAGRSEVRTTPRLVPRRGPVLRGSRRLFAGSGTFDHVSWTPDERWVLVGWPAADQWVFVRSKGAGIRGVANVSEQFRSRSFPRIEGWCCGG